MNNSESEIEDIVLLLSYNVVTVTGLICLFAQQQLTRERQNVMYRSPLPVPVGQIFSLELLTEEYCVQFFR
jgi:hypothetical protein